MTLDSILKQLEAKPKLDLKDATDGLWETTETKLLSFLRQANTPSLPYPVFVSPVGGYIYVYFVTNNFKLPLCIRLESFEAFQNSLNQVYTSVVTQNARI